MTRFGTGGRSGLSEYMLKTWELANVPDVGGALVQWHVHDNPCFSPSGYVQGITNALGQCPAGQIKPIPTPMVHVWTDLTVHPVLRRTALR